MPLACVLGDASSDASDTIMFAKSAHKRPREATTNLSPVCSRPRQDRNDGDVERILDVADVAKFLPLPVTNEGRHGRDLERSISKSKASTHCHRLPLSSRVLHLQRSTGQGSRGAFYVLRLLSHAKKLLQLYPPFDMQKTENCSQRHIQIPSERFDASSGLSKSTKQNNCWSSTLNQTLITRTAPAPRSIGLPSSLRRSLR